MLLRSIIVAGYDGVHCNPALGRQKQVDLCEFEVSLVCIGQIGLDRYISCLFFSSKLFTGYVFYCAQNYTAGVLLDL